MRLLDFLIQETGKMHFDSAGAGGGLPEVIRHRIVLCVREVRLSG
jgi:hypothetical protein